MKKKQKKLRLLTSGLIIVILLLISSVAYISYALKPIQKTSAEFVLVIEKGDTARSITAFLDDNNVIKDQTIAYLYVKQVGLTNIKVGTYRIDKSWDVKRIFTLLNDPKGAENTDVKVTLQEGLWAKEMAKKIADVTNVTAEELLSLWNDKAYIASIMDKYPFLTDEVFDERLKVKLEGYLFPETYYFFKNATAVGITEKILDQTLKIYRKYENEFAKSKYSIHELFTLASITQFEAGNDADNKIISGIWFNRLDAKMFLQSSVTVCYALYDYDHWRACEVNPQLDSPYNTYRYGGIPIGPIANPGESALASVLYPTKSDYLFFIADVYGDGTIYYAKTYAEHQANINKYLK